MMKRIVLALAVVIIATSAALLVPVARATFQGQQAPYASYRMQGSIGNLNGATVDHVEWTQRGGHTGTTNIIARDDLETIVEFGESTDSGSGFNVFELKVFYNNPAVPGEIGTITDSVSIEVLAADVPDSESGIPEVDAGPDAVVFEGNFAE